MLCLLVFLWKDLDGFKSIKVVGHIFFLMYANRALISVTGFFYYLQEHVYNLLSKVLEAKRLCIQEGNHCPNKEELATRVGITVEKLDNLLFFTRMPLSMQQPIWPDQDTTFQVMVLAKFPSGSTKLYKMMIF